MSSPVVDQTSRMHGAVTPNGSAANGTGLSFIHPEQAPLNVTDFGIFHDEIKNDMVKLEKGRSDIEETTTRLIRTFHKYGKVVSTIKERYGVDNALEQKSRDLESQKKGFDEVIYNNTQKYLNQISDLEGRHSSEIISLKNKHNKEISDWKEIAAAGERERKRYEELGKGLTIRAAEDKLKMETEFNKKESQMNDEITKLREANRVCKDRLLSTSDDLVRVRAKCLDLEEQNNDLRAPYRTVSMPAKD